MKVAVLGSGISGLFTCWACESRGISTDSIDIISLPYKPTARGFQYLHKPCELNLRPYLLEEDIVPNYFPKTVSSSLYSFKVYGRPDIPNSIDRSSSFPVISSVYNMNEAISILWDKYEHRIKSREIRGLNDLSRYSKEYDKVFSTIPIYNYISHYNLESVISYISTFNVDSCENFVKYDLNVDSSIIRFGSIFSEFFIESIKPLNIGNTFHKVDKVIKCNKEVDIPNNVILLGRYGSWDKTEMAHTVYEKVLEVLS